VHITGKMSVVKGYIYVREKIEGHSFQQTLVPVTNDGYRLYVNGLMLKGSDSKPGDTVKFIIEQNPIPRTLDSYPIPEEFKKALEENNLFAEFKKLAPSRQKEILTYLGFLKTKEPIIKNIKRVIDQLKAFADKR